MEMKKALFRPAMAVMICASLLLGNAHAQTPPADAPDAPVKAKPKKKARVATRGMPKFLPGSQETAKERSTRLKRECKDGVNAGVCKGYTS